MSEDLFQRAERAMATSRSLWSRTVDLIADGHVGTELKLVQFRLRALINSGALPSLDDAQSQDISEAPWLVRAYLSLPPAWWLLGKQTLYVGVQA